MNLHNIERKRNKVNQAIYGLLVMVVFVFVLILIVLQLQHKEILNRNELASDYHLNISEKSLKLLSVIDKSRVWFREYDLDRYSKPGVGKNELTVSPISMGFSARDNVDALKYEIEKYVSLISNVQMQYADPEFSAITEIMNKEKIQIKAGFNKLQLNAHSLSSKLDDVLQPLISATHQIQLLHQHAYNRLQISSDDFQREKRNQLIFLIVIFTIVGLFGVARLLLLVRLALTSLTSVQQLLHKQSLIIDQIHDSVISTDINGGITSWNKGSETLLGYKYEEMQGKHVSTIYPIEDREFLQNKIISPLHEKGQLETEVRLQHKSGEIFFAHLSLSMLYDDKGVAVGMIGYSMDINESKLAKISLQNSEQRYRSLVLATSSIIWTTDESGGFVEPQDSWEKYTGQSRDKYKDFGWTKVIHPDDVEHILIAWEEARQNNSICESNGRIWNEGLQQWRDFEVKSVPVMDSEGILCEWVGVITDVTDRKQAEEDNLRLASIVKYSSDFIGISNMEGHALFLNDAGRKMVSIEKDEDFLETMIFDYFPKEDRDRLEGEILPIVMSEGRWAGEINFRDFKSGRIIPTWFDTFRIDDPVTGAPINLATVTQDITERKQVERDLVNEKNKAQNYLDIAAVMLVAINTEGVVTLVNRKGCEVLGYKENEIIGTNWFDNYLPEVLRKNVLEIFKQLMRGDIKPVEFYESIIVTCKGDERAIAWHNSILYDEAGGICGTLSSGTDITDIKAAEAELEQHQQHLEKLVEERTLSLAAARDDSQHANASKSEFLSRMSHELRTPMNAILGFGQILEMQSDGFNETQKSNVSEILDAGRHLLHLINDVLDMARIESGRMEVSIDKVHVNDVVQKSIALVQSQAKVRDVEIVDCLSNNEYFVSADFTRVTQVLVNLLSNAVKYNHVHGCITLDSEVVSDKVLRIRVIDTGDGLSEEEISKLFTSFERLNSTNNVEGTGIGLVITKHLMGLMGGEIGVDSVQGKGSAFWIELPLYIDG